MELLVLPNNRRLPFDSGANLLDPRWLGGEPTCAAHQRWLTLYAPSPKILEYRPSIFMPTPSIPAGSEYLGQLDDL
jgi:hypothetical protein